MDEKLRIPSVSTGLAWIAHPPALAAPDNPNDVLLARVHSEPPHPYRGGYARDIGRILHAKSFRRLAGKTQVFTRRPAESDHSRSRLTHTLEVAQIARTVASSLGLNSALAEALALVHDIGHPPFGHAGEEALDACLRGHGMRFDHNVHALRIVTSFEDRYAAFRGLNLTFAVREGIVKHSRDYSAGQHPELSEYMLDLKPPLEAQLIDLADEIAYLAADLEDGLSVGILELEQVQAQVPLFNGFYEKAREQFRSAPANLLTNEALKQMLNALVTDLMQETVHELHTLQIESLADLRRAPHRVARLSQAMEDERKKTKTFLYNHLYMSPQLEVEHARAREVIETLFTLWTANPDLLPADHRERLREEGTPRTVADYIAGMTDSYIEQAWLKTQATEPSPVAAAAAYPTHIPPHSAPPGEDCR